MVLRRTYLSLMSKAQRAWRKSRHELGELRLLAADAAIRWPRMAETKDSVLIVRVDAIGDYMLFRQSLRALRSVPRFHGKKLVLCGNAVWQELAETLDPDAFDAFVPVERGRFLKNRQYRHELFAYLRTQGFSIALQPTFSRDYIGDSLVRASGAPERISFNDPGQNTSCVARFFFNRCYTELIQPQGGYPFELERNAEILAYFHVAQKNIPPFKDVIPESFNAHLSPGIESLCGSPVFFLGASEKGKRWPASFFAELVPFVFEKSKRPIILGGGADFKDEMNYITSLVQAQAVSVPETSLLEMVALIANAPLLISNDSFAAHCGATYGVPTVIISNGLAKGRFHPYPENLAPYVHTIYPASVAARGFEFYYSTTHAPVSDVTPEQVMNLLAKLGW